MIPFLKQVAEKYLTGPGTDSRCFIFPNRRSMVFFRKYLAEAVVTSGSRPVAVPDMFTIDDFFSRIYGTGPSDRVTLLLELYGCYGSLNQKAETLDEFIFWGDIILGDFNDVDKYLADPEQLFANVADFKAIQDSFEYLTETQRRAVENFVSHFNDRSGRLTVDLKAENPDVKARFLQIWNILYPLYCLYGRTLSEKGLSYEGMVYRGLVRRLEKESAADILSGLFPEGMKFVFVGLNALNECEKTLMRKLRDSGLAEFCWDYSGDMIRDRRNRSSFFMGENVKEFPQTYSWDPEGVRIPDFRVISVPSSTGQVKQVPGILDEIASGQTGGDLSRVGVMDGTEGGADCAVVLPDENLLMPLLNTLPPEIRSVNVTMGYPMTGSAFYSLMSGISALQMHLRKRAGEWGFYYRQVWPLFSSSILRKVMGEADLEVVKKVKEGAKVYVPAGDFSSSPVLSAVFTPVVTDPAAADGRQISDFCSYQLDIISRIAPMLKDDPDMMVELEFAKEYYRCVNRLRNACLQVQPITYIRILDQLLGAVSVPFRGEPLKGLQIMGPLETRALDFRNIILLSANEGIFPRRSVSSSFIPPELRKGFGLPTYEYQDAVWAYYFYRMIARAENVWILYDSRTEGMKTGEESRYIKQLEYHFRIDIRRYAADARSKSVVLGDEIRKTEAHVGKIRSGWLSASSVQNYIACPVRFFYSTVEGLSAEEEVAESMDASMIGKVYHGVMRCLYTGEHAMETGYDPDAPENRFARPMDRVTTDYLASWKKRMPEIKAKVRAMMMIQLKDSEITGRNLVIEDVIVKYVAKTVDRDMELMSEKGVGYFSIIGLERELKAEEGGFRFKGYIDRIDSFSPDSIRVVDYKTGKVLPEDMSVTEADGAGTASLMFGDIPFFKKPKIAFQLFIYDMLLRKNGLDRGRQISDAVYSTAGLFTAPPHTAVMGESFYRAMEEGLCGVLEEMADLSVPFRRTEDTASCQYCDFRNICGR